MYGNNEAFNERKKLESDLMNRWHVALEADGGIKSESMARNCAIVLENYYKWLNKNPVLVAEDQVQTGDFTGVNLALIGLIRRVIPEIIGAELVGMQAMPTPRAPIFTMTWERNTTKGLTTKGDDVWDTPATTGSISQDPFDYSSNQLKEVVAVAAVADDAVIKAFSWANNGTDDEAHGVTPKASYVVANTALLVRVSTTGATKGRITDAVRFNAAYYGSGDVAGTLVFGDAANLGSNIAANTTIGSAVAELAVAKIATPSTSPGLNVYNRSGLSITPATNVYLIYESNFEGNVNMPEYGFKITDQTVKLIKRQIRGRFTLDAAYDIKTLHAIDLESEMVNMMKLDITNGINREIVDDVRKMAAIYDTLDYSADYGSVITPIGNYDDSHKILLDRINRIANVIWNVGRLGRGNFIVGNPVTLSFLDRVGGFVGSGVSADGRNLAFQGNLGRLKFYNDVQYPQGELLIGYKGTGNLDTGYLHCPYLPVTATPTMHNQLTGDPIKIFFTRYAKTYRDFNPETGNVNENLIYRGQFQYARLNVASTSGFNPGSLVGSYGP